jgi:UDPglucose 6-dehydrogenase
VIKLQDMIGDLSGKCIGVLGLAFKENTDDIRESPALRIAEMIHELGATIRGYDPVAMEHVERHMPFIELCPDPYTMAKGCDALVVATPWNEFKSLDMSQICGEMKQPVIVDGRNLYDGRQLRAMGFQYRGVGRGLKGTMESTASIK